MNIRRFLNQAVLALGLPLAVSACAQEPQATQTQTQTQAAAAAAAPTVTEGTADGDQFRPLLVVHKTPWCGCCTAWVDHMREAGFAVRVTEMEDLEPLKARHGVTAELASCHTALIGGYVVEGHVPAADVARLLKERPEATGLAVPGMPVGSPGMEMGNEQDPYEVVLFGPGTRETFSRY